MGLALTSFHVALVFIAAAIFVAAGASDASEYRIPNYLSGLLLLIFPIFVLTAPHEIDWIQHVMIFGLVGLSGFAMFLAHKVGAGDVKLLAAASLWAGPHLIAVLLVVTALAGGVLSVIMAILTHMRGRGDPARVDIAKVSIPYGIAIACGGMTTLGMTVRPILFPQ